MKLEWSKVDEENLSTDPYTIWLLRTAHHTLELERFSDDPEPEIQLVEDAKERQFLALSEEKKVSADGEDVKDKSAITWDSKSDLTQRNVIRLVAKPFDGNVLSSGLEKFLSEDFSFSFPFLEPGLEENAQPSGENYAQLAPLDGNMIPEYVDTSPAQYDPPDDVDREKAVILAVIDDGINIAHENFQTKANQSRVDFAWHMDGIARSPDEKNPSSVLFGREIFRGEIEDALKNAPNEELALRKLGLIDPASGNSSSLSRRFSHGTHVLGQMAGYPMDGSRYPGSTASDDPRSDRRLITVQLPRRVTVETSSALYALFALAGIRYIFERAKTMAAEIKKDGQRKIPLVVNFSYGVSGGPHNGQHLVERMLTDLVDEVDADPNVGPLIVTLPAGNRYLASTHAHMQARYDGPTSLDLFWTTQANDQSSNYLEIWVPEDAKDEKLELKIELMGSSAVQRRTLYLDLRALREVEAYELLLPNKKKDDPPFVLGRISVDRLDANQLKDTKDAEKSKDKIRVLIALAPTYPTKSNGVAAPAGQWRISASLTLKRDQWIEAWIQRDDTPPGFRRQGLPSYLEQDERPDHIKRSDSLEKFMKPLPPGENVSRYGSVSGISTGAKILSVAGLRLYGDTHLPSSYSGAASANTPAPKLAAPADRSNVFSGIIGLSSRSGGTLGINGTSVSAPMTARAAADFLSGSRVPKTSEAALEKFVERYTDEPKKGDEISPAEIALIDKQLRSQRGVQKILKSAKPYSGKRPDR